MAKPEEAPVPEGRCAWCGRTCEAIWDEGGLYGACCHMTGARTGQHNTGCHPFKPASPSPAPTRTYHSTANPPPDVREVGIPFTYSEEAA